MLSRTYPQNPWFRVQACGFRVRHLFVQADGITGRCSGARFWQCLTFRGQCLQLRKLKPTGSEALNLGLHDGKAFAFATNFAFRAKCSLVGQQPVSPREPFGAHKPRAVHPGCPSQRREGPELGYAGGSSCETARARVLLCRAELVILSRMPWCNSRPSLWKADSSPFLSRPSSEREQIRLAVLMNEGLL